MIYDADCARELSDQGLLTAVVHLRSLRSALSPANPLHPTLAADDATLCAEMKRRWPECRPEGAQA